MPEELQTPQLSDIEGVSKRPVDALARVAIFDAEQLLALANVKGLGGPLHELINCAEEEVALLISSASEALAKSTPDLPSPLPVMSFTLGALATTPTTRAEGDQMTKPSKGPKKPPVRVDFSSEMPAVRNQGARGTCVAFAASAVHERYRQVKGGGEDYSEQFLYHRIKAMDGVPKTCGTWIVKAARVLKDQGQCREGTWAYNPNLPCNKNGSQPGTAATEAKKHKPAAVMLKARSVSEIKKTLASGMAVAVGFPVYRSWYRSSAAMRTGNITMPVRKDVREGGHAVCLVGYRDAFKQPGGGLFFVRNSWSTGWGSGGEIGGGYGTIPYAYIEKYAFEAFTIQ